jgi:hypothetical protein
MYITGAPTRQLEETLSGVNDRLNIVIKKHGTLSREDLDFLIAAMTNPRTAVHILLTLRPPEMLADNRAIEAQRLLHALNKFDNPFLSIAAEIEKELDRYRENTLLN